jgi:replication factor A1
MGLEDYMKVESLKPSFRNVNLVVKIVNIGSSRSLFSRRSRRQHTLADAFVGDETGSVVMTLWDDQIGKFKAGDVVEMKDGYTSLYKGSLRLNVGRTGSIEKVDAQIGEVDTRNNLSETTHIKVPWRSSEARPFRRRKRR